MAVALRITRCCSVQRFGSGYILKPNVSLLRMQINGTSSQPKRAESGESTNPTPPPPPPSSQKPNNKPSTNKAHLPKLSQVRELEEKLASKASSVRDETLKKSAAIKQKLSPENVRQNVQGYMFTRYFEVVKNYDKVLEKNFPSAVKVYRVFFDGVKDFFTDMKSYLKISRIINNSPEGLRALNRKELELYMQMPRDMVKVAPALVLTSLPAVGYAMFPLIFMYPRTLLTSHFWTEQQKVNFQQIHMQHRLSSNRAVFRILQAKLRTVRSQDSYPQLKRALGLMGSGFHPSVEEILKTKDAFSKTPYNLDSLSNKHLKLLCEVHGLRKGWFKRHRLTEHAFLVHHMDLAITREGGVHNMRLEGIRKACFIRGLNPVNLSNDEMIEWMRSWIKISTTIEEQHISLFLHLPLLLAYNHPNNWQLIYGKSHKSSQIKDE